MVFSKLTKPGNVLFIYIRRVLVGKKQSKRISAKIRLLYNCYNKTGNHDCNTTILLRRNFWGLSCVIFWKFGKFLKKFFENLWNDYIRLEKHDKIFTPSF